MDKIAFLVALLTSGLGFSGYVVYAMLKQTREGEEAGRVLAAQSNESYMRELWGPKG